MHVTPQSWRELVYSLTLLHTAGHQRKEAWERTSYTCRSWCSCSQWERKVFALFHWQRVTVFLSNLWERLYAAQEGSRVTLNCFTTLTDKETLSVPLAAWLPNAKPNWPSGTPMEDASEQKTVLGRVKWSAAGYLSSFQMLPFLFPLTREVAGTDKPLPGVKPFPRVMLNRVHFTLVQRQVISSNLRIPKMAVHFPSVQPSLCVPLSWIR